MSISIGSDNSLILSEEDDDSSLIDLEAHWFRLIPSRFPPVSIYERIIANDRVAELVETENITNPRLRRANFLTKGIDPIDPESPILQNWNLASFTYPQPDGTRFFRPVCSCLELSDDLQTALAVSVKRREWFLQQTEEPPQGIDMRVLKTPIKGRFLDLRYLPVSLVESVRWQIGDYVTEKEYDGIIFAPEERPSAACIGVLKEHALGRSQQTKHFRFHWNGQRISSLYAFDNAQEIEPAALSGSKVAIAA